MEQVIARWILIVIMIVGLLAEEFWWVRIVIGLTVLVVISLGYLSGVLYLLVGLWSIGYGIHAGINMDNEGEA